MTQRKTRKTKDLHETPTSEIAPDVYECTEFLADWNQSLLTFYLGRVQQYMKIPFEIHDPTSPEDYVNSHERFLGKMIEDYANQSENFLKIVRNNNPEKKDHSQSGYEPSLLKAQEDAAKIIDQAKVQAERIIAAANAQAEQIVQEPVHKPQEAKPAQRKTA